MTGDLSAEVIFGTEDDGGHLKLQAWQRISKYAFVFHSDFLNSFFVFIAVYIWRKKVLQ